MAKASAPGKIIFFGEHAVVFGEPAIAGAIDKRIYVSAEETRAGKLEISSSEEISDGHPYVKKAVELASSFLGEDRGLEIGIETEFPPASGLGSSAAVSVSTILAISTLLGKSIDKKDLARLGHQVEKKVQGAASITDASVTTFGGLLFVKPLLETVEPIEVGKLPVVVGYTGHLGETKELVRKVKNLKERNPEIMEPIIRTMGRITVKARRLLEEGEDIGELMDINQGLLESIGVGSAELSRYVHAARRAGASGAKLTGAGGGGCMIAYSRGKESDVARAIEDEGGLAMRVLISREGARVEKK